MLLSLTVGDVRNDIYVTIKGGEFTRGPAKTADKNVEVTMVVCNNKGEVLKVGVAILPNQMEEFKINA